MLERFDEIMVEVMEEMDMEWYEVYDSEAFDLVDERLEAEFGSEVFDTEEYSTWVREMYWDL